MGGDHLDGWLRLRLRLRNTNRGRLGLQVLKVSDRDRYHWDRNHSAGIVRNIRLRIYFFEFVNEYGDNLSEAV